MILLLGANGSMGKRYQAILKYLGASYLPIEVNDKIPKMVFDGAIIATPTDTHKGLIKQFHNMPILCEKPVCKSLLELNETLDYCRDNNVHFTMMNQYALLDDPNSTGPTSYNFYNTGKDGIYWDCLQIIGLARTTIDIKNQSPYWHCWLNGKKINIAMMDHAYIDFVKKWLTFQKFQSLDYLREIHYRTHEYASNQSSHRNSGTVYKSAVSG
jgi:hypothetical protein